MKSEENSLEKRVLNSNLSDDDKIEIIRILTLRQSITPKLVPIPQTDEHNRSDQPTWSHYEITCSCAKQNNKMKEE